MDNDSAEEKKAMLETIVGMFNSGDLSNVERMFSPHYIDHQKPPDIDIDGPEEFKRIVTGARRSLPNLRVTIKDIKVEGDVLIARLLWHSSDLRGKEIYRETEDVLRFKEGCAIEHWGKEIAKQERRLGEGG